MNPRVSLLPVLFAVSSLVALTPAVAAPQADIAPPTQRQAATQQAAQLVAKPTPATTTIKPSATPFSPSGFDAPSTEAPRVAPTLEKDVAPVKPTTPHETLLALGNAIQVKGSMTVAGVKSLTIKSESGQITAKVGGKITVPFQGATYEVRIVAIDASSYTIEWNGENLTRPTNASTLDVRFAPTAGEAVVIKRDPAVGTVKPLVVQFDLRLAELG
jgi:hypothetical protein